MELIKVDSNEEILKREINVRKKLHDLPLQNKDMNIISIVVAYKMFGLSNVDIMQMIGINEEQLGNILVSEAYKKCFDQILENIMQNEAKDVQQEFKRVSMGMVRNIVQLANESKVDVVKLGASQDILDRAGYRADDLMRGEIESKGNQLNIVVIKK